MFFAITALIVSAVQIVIGVAIGISVTRHRRREAEEATPPATQSERLAVSAERAKKAPAAASPAATAPQPKAPATSAADAERDNPRSIAARRQPDESAQDKRQQTDPSGRAPDAKRSLADRDRTAPRNAQADPGDTAVALLCETPDAVATPSGRERRIATRRIFDYRQFVAPYQGGSLPGKASFREVECQDISATGFSFLSSQLPDFDSLVVALGVAPHMIYVRALIVNRFQIDDGAAPLYRIGCRFAEQVN